MIRLGRPFALGLDQAHDPVGIPDSRDLGRGYNDHSIGWGYRISISLFNACRRIDHDKVKIGTQLVAQSNHLLGIDRRLVPRLRCRK